MSYKQQQQKTRTGKTKTKKKTKRNIVKIIIKANVNY